MIRDRIQDLRRVPVSALRPHPGNWRLHPQRQRRAMAHVLEKIGYADALLVRPLDDAAGEATYEIIDGHLRAETTPDAEVPVLVLDLSAAEAQLLLATHDPLTAMAETDGPALAALLDRLQIEDAAFDEHLAELATAADSPLDSGDTPTECDIPESYQVLIECADEGEQRELFEQLQAEGWQCRVLTL